MSRRDFISEHALVRWLERASRIDLAASRAAFERMRGREPADGELLAFLARFEGLDLPAVRAEMLTANVRRAIAAGCASVRLKGLRLIVKNGVVVTVVRPRQEKLVDRFERGRPRPRRRSSAHWQRDWE